MKQQVDKNGVLILLVSLLFITGLPAWVAYICGGDFLIKNLYGLLGCLLLLFLPLYFRKTWGDCASFDITLLPEKKRYYFIIVPFTFLLLIISCSVGYIIIKMGIQKPYIYTSNTNLLFFNCNSKRSSTPTNLLVSRNLNSLRAHHKFLAIRLIALAKTVWLRQANNSKMKVRSTRLNLMNQRRHIQRLSALLWR